MPCPHGWVGFDMQVCLPTTVVPACEKRKRYIVKSTGKDTGGRAQTCLCHPAFGARFLGFDGSVEELTARFWWERFRAWPFIIRPGKRLQHRLFLDSGPFASERVLMFGVQACPSLCFCGGQDFGSGCYWRSKFSPMSTFWLQGLWFCVVISGKQLSILLETG